MVREERYTEMGEDEVIEKVEERERSRGGDGRLAAQGPASVRKERGRGMRERKALIPTTRLTEDQATRPRYACAPFESGR